MPVKILMVCLGNICRSPLAEGILKSKLPRKSFVVDSAGTGSWHIGKQPDERSIAIARKNGIDISNQRGKQFTVNDFETYDYIYVMDNSNFDDVSKLAQSQEQMTKVQLILNEVFPGENVDVPDPYYGSQFGFETVFKMLDETCDSLAEKLMAKHT